MSNFDYLIKKIEEVDFSNKPYKHIYIDDFLSEEHFRAILGSPEIKFNEDISSDKDLFKKLYANGYKIIKFPGCTTDEEQYIKWHNNKTNLEHHTATEGAGMTLRLFEASSSIIEELKSFIESDTFRNCLASKFGLESLSTNYDVGIQKYLDGYEISPHPDLRRKALTFMVNINPSLESESANHHTHYLKFKPEKAFIEKFWQFNEKIERCWVPWDWCDSVFQQTKNNSIVIFSPSYDTLHAVKASYDHLKTQRTQLYGNLWYDTLDVENRLDWEDYDLMANRERRLQSHTISNKIKRGGEYAIRKLKRSPSSDNIGKRKDDPYGE
jgi:hypothetical protein